MERKFLVPEDFAERLEKAGFKMTKTQKIDDKYLDTKVRLKTTFKIKIKPCTNPYS